MLANAIKYNNDNKMLYAGRDTAWQSFKLVLIITNRVFVAYFLCHSFLWSV